MIDFFSKNIHNTKTAKQLMKDIFNLEETKIMVCYLDKLGEISIGNNIECLCVISSMNGSVGCLLQIYRIEIDFNLFLEKLKYLSNLYEDDFFVPYDNFNGYYKISKKSSIKQVVYDEKKSNDNYVYFLDTKEI